MDNLEEEFKKSVDRIRRKSIFSSEEEVLSLYGLYAHVMAGECIEPQAWS